MDFDWVEIGAKIASFIGACIGFFGASIIVFFTYKSIAWNFNLPSLNYWTICGTVYTIKYLFNHFSKKEEE